MVAIGEFEILLTVMSILGTAILSWLWRHERYFRDRVFPIIQTLTGRDPRGETPDPTNVGHFEETDDRISRVAEDVEEAKNTGQEAYEVAVETREEVEEVRAEVRALSEDQKAHNRQTASILREILSAVDVQPSEDAEFPFGDHYHESDGDD